ncbi:hypothetical protein QYM36_008369 [Artemia franciscana]|uniref:Bestrophin homolog n=1 Tax=Artemia franciscana TaxID=6661 RepID=A0AA88IUZ0_ARTSF|nr:hypothetical protein QYM36_008369 [Artemia franciscana]
MTVSYQYEVASSTSGGFTRLLLKWKGSLYKLIYREMIAFLLLFITVSLIYRMALNESQQRYFESLARFFDRYLEMIPLSFVLGFYVTTIANRWWQQYVALPWPDKDEESRLIRRTLLRYTNLMMILVLRSISLAVKRRFPTLEHVVESGIMTKRELESFKSIQTEFNTYWIPSCWFVDLLRECRTTKKLIDPPGMRFVMQEFLDIRSKCSLLWSYDWISFPLVYTQVVTLATYTFYLACIVARQNLLVSEDDRLAVDDYFPIFTILQLLFYMGLLKVAEQMINPFGDDDEDFELNFLIDRHTKVSYLVVDQIHQNSPLIEKDIHFDEIDPTLPYTEASVHHKKDTYKGSAADIIVPQKKQTLSIPVSLDEGVDEESSMRSFRLQSRDDRPGHTMGSITERLGNGKNSSSRQQSQDNPGFNGDCTIESGLKTVISLGSSETTQLSNSNLNIPNFLPTSKQKCLTNQRPSIFQSQILNRSNFENKSKIKSDCDSTPEFLIDDKPMPVRRSRKESKQKSIEENDARNTERKPSYETLNTSALSNPNPETDDEDDGL